jgi:homoserine acetyltransferase
LKEHDHDAYGWRHAPRAARARTRRSPRHSRPRHHRPRLSRCSRRPAGLRTLEGDYVIPNFRFASGEALPELRLHFTTSGKARRDEHGRVTNAVLLLHGTGGSGHSFLAAIRRRAVRQGTAARCERYYIIMPDAIGHGASSKPSDGLHAHFPQYDYEDMVSAQYALLTQSLRSIICA